ncbi:MAG TPA: hypothetical protein VHC97_22845 [Thermoanaerobaculia bacterium]|jgi:tetratricopeptide (TPR) repeat protein|nr:hypothetical protein [Thermoanaerobaculia bacterium]
MTEDHPDAQLLERFMRNETEGGERRLVVRHLLTGCARCVAVTRRFWSLSETAAPEGVQENPPQREAPLRLSELLDLSRTQGLARIEADRRFQNPAVCELLIGESQRAGEPALAVVRAEWAVAVAERLDVRRYGATLTRNLRGRAWAWLGNARRLAGDRRGAEAALSQAEEPLQEGIDPLDGAELAELRARLLADQGKLEEAELLLDRTLALYRTLRERHLEARVLIQKGTVRGWAPGREAMLQGIRILEEGLALLGGDREAPLVAFGLHRLALLFADVGRTEEAVRTLRRARVLYERQGDGPNLVRLRHLEGKIAEARGDSAAAEAAFHEARQGFVAEGLGVEAAGVLFDLAILYTRTGRSPEIRPLAEDLLPILCTRDIRQGVAAALLFFRRLVETEHATLEALSAVAHYVTGPPRERRPALR